MAENKTKPTAASVEEYLAARANGRQRADCDVLMAMFQRLTGEEPRMWGPSIVGYGSFRYRYETGRTGDSPLAAFAVRGRDLVVYLDCDADEQQARLARLGKHSMGKSCLYFRSLSDLDLDVLEQLVAGSMAEAERRYGPFSRPSS